MKNAAISGLPVSVAIYGLLDPQMKRRLKAAGRKLTSITIGYSLNICPTMDKISGRRSLPVPAKTPEMVS